MERKITDDALGAEASADDAAAAVITKARERADSLLAATRAKSDEQAAAAPAVQSPNAVATQRVREDQTVKEERADADEAVRADREAHASVLSAEREETDNDLLSERIRSDTALATRDEFLGVVSHDLRNILSTIVGAASMIAAEPPSEGHVENVRNNVHRIQRSATRMNRLIGDLIDVASIEAGRLAVRLEESDPAQSIAEAVESYRALAASKGIALSTELISAAHATFDPARIQQVLLNLLSNALKFTPRDGRVVVRLERVGGDLRFAVSDTGDGVPVDMLGPIFERFVQVATRDRRGLGLGLYISKCIVEGHGGRIWAESVVGQGSTFHFTLPIHPASPPRPA